MTAGCAAGGGRNLRHQPAHDQEQRERVHTYLAALLELESEDDFGLARLVRATLFVHASV